MIGSDATLEVAMELLSAAGIGPANYIARASEGFKVVLHRSPGSIFIGRHTPDEYREFYECLEAAKHQPEELEEALPKMLLVAQRWTYITECFGADDEGRDVVGHGMSLLAWIMMRAGCAFPPGLKTEFLDTLDREAENWDNPERNLVRANFRGLVEQYSEDPENCVALGNNVITFDDYMSGGNGGDGEHPLMSAAAIASRNYTHKHERTKESIVKRMQATRMVGKLADKMHKQNMAGPITSTQDPRTKSSGPMVRACGWCEKPEAWHGDGGKGVKLLTCSGCGIAWFCGAACQREAWPSHKADCKKNKQRAVALGVEGL